MKKVNLNGKTLFYPENDDDEMFLLRDNLLLYFKDKDGFIHCQDFVKKLSVIFKNGKWLPEEYKARDESQRRLNLDEVLKETDGVTPAQGLKDVENAMADKARDELVQKLNKKSRHRVIGYTKAGRFIESEEDYDSYYIALLQDIRKHQYLFTGDEMDAVPVFEDYTTLDFSTRGWGKVIADSQLETDLMAYTNYTDAMFFQSSMLNFPDQKSYARRKSQGVLLPEIYYGLEEAVRKASSKNYAGGLFLVPLEKEGFRFYWDWSYFPNIILSSQGYPAKEFHVLDLKDLTRSDYAEDFYDHLNFRLNDYADLRKKDIFTYIDHEHIDSRIRDGYARTVALFIINSGNYEIIY